MSKPNREAIAETLDALRQQYPQAFTDPPRPLKIGISRELSETSEQLGISKTRIRAAIQFWTNRNPYHYHLAQPEAQRVDLTGNAVEPVSDEHRQYAIDTLKARAKAKAERQKQQHLAENEAASNRKVSSVVETNQNDSSPGTGVATSTAAAPSNMAELTAILAKPKKPKRKGTTLTLKRASA